MVSVVKNFFRIKRPGAFICTRKNKRQKPIFRLNALGVYSENSGIAKLFGNKLRCPFSCWINPSLITLGVMLPMSLILLGDICLTVLLIWTFFFADKINAPLNASVSANRKIFWRKVQLLLTMQIFLGAPWVRTECRYNTCTVKSP